MKNMDYFYQYEDLVHNYFRYRIYTDFTYPAHMHEYFELFYVFSGECTLRTDVTVERMTEGSLALIMPSQIHAYESPYKCRSYLARFSVDYVKQFANDYASKLPVKLSYKCSDLTDQLLRRCLSDNDISSESKLLYKKSALSFICAEFSERVSYSQRKARPGEIGRQIMIYIIQNFREPITLSSIADEFGYDKNYLSACFHDSFDLNFRDALNYHRVEYAKLLIETTAMSLTDIATSSGFQSYRSFNRAFIELVGKHPRDFRH